MWHIFCIDTVLYSLQLETMTWCTVVQTHRFSFQIFLGSGCIFTCVPLMQLLKNTPMPSAPVWWYLTYHDLFAKFHFKLLSFFFFFWCQCNYKRMPFQRGGTFLAATAAVSQQSVCACCCRLVWKCHSGLYAVWWRDVFLFGQMLPFCCNILVFGFLVLVWWLIHIPVGHELMSELPRWRGMDKLAWQMVHTATVHTGTLMMNGWINDECTSIIGFKLNNAEPKNNYITANVCRRNRCWCEKKIV